MEQLNIGDKLKVKSRSGDWVPIEKVYFREATEYEWRYSCEQTQHLDIRMNNFPLPYSIKDNEFNGMFITPFQVGNITFIINSESLNSYIYPDSRKMTEHQYQQMLKEILDEAALCFELSGFSQSIDMSGLTREISWPQWNYIQTEFKKLERIVGKILDKPHRFLKNQNELVLKEKVKSITVGTERWLEKEMKFESMTRLPSYINVSKRVETFNTYENQYMKRNIQQLGWLLDVYQKEINVSVNHYKSKINYWLHRTFLKDVRVTEKSTSITQVMKKHPQYRQMKTWFDELYQFKDYKIGFDYQIPLKETFALYEMWCYMKILKYLRLQGLVENTNDLYKISKSSIFLDLATNKESRVQLKKGANLYFQRIYQSNTKKFYTYSHRMIPDIVIEFETQLYVFDPKYRVPGNLSMALGEMHKYRDGILHKESGKHAVKEVYILTPEKGEGKDFFDEKYHKNYNMGAIEVKVGSTTENEISLLDNVVDSIFIFETQTL